LAQALSLEIATRLRWRKNPLQKQDDLVNIIGDPHSLAMSGLDSLPEMRVRPATVIVVTSYDAPVVHTKAAPCALPATCQNHV
jgi:hypothetical protein